MQNRKRDTDVQNRLLDSVGEGEGGIFQENSIETCILSRVKQITSPGWMHETSARTWCMLVFFKCESFIYLVHCVYWTKLFSPSSQTTC